MQKRPIEYAKEIYQIRKGDLLNTQKRPIKYLRSVARAVSVKRDPLDMQKRPIEYAKETY